MTQPDKLMIEIVAKAIYKSRKSYIGSMKDCEVAARHALKTIDKYKEKSAKTSGDN